MGAFNAGFSSLFTANALNNSFRVQNINETRLGLANQVGPDMTPTQIAGIAQTDKALTLEGESNKISQLANETMQKAGKSMMQKYWEHRRKAIENGYLF